MIFYYLPSLIIIDLICHDAKFKRDWKPIKKRDQVIDFYLYSIFSFSLNIGKSEEYVLHIYVP